MKFKSCPNVSKCSVITLRSIPAFAGNNNTKAGMKRSAMTVLFVCIALCFLPGCGKPKIDGLVPVRGTITYNGEPLADAAVCFTPKEFNTGDRLATGKTDAQGRFELRTIGELGVLPNEYTVVIIKNEMLQGDPRRQVPGRPPSPEIRSVIPKRYGNQKTSNLHITVGRDGLRDLRLEIHD